MKHTHTAFVCLKSTAQPASKALTLYLCFKHACRTDTTSVEKKRKDYTFWHQSKEKPSIIHIYVVASPNRPYHSTVVKLPSATKTQVLLSLRWREGCAVLCAYMQYKVMQIHQSTALNRNHKKKLTLRQSSRVCKWEPPDSLQQNAGIASKLSLPMHVVGCMSRLQADGTHQI